MKVNLYTTVEISDEQRVKLGAVLDGKVKPKRQATRDEIKDFLWTHGSGWAMDLADLYAELVDEPVSRDNEPGDEDLLGSADDTTQEEADEADEDYGDLI